MGGAYLCFHLPKQHLRSEDEFNYWDSFIVTKRADYALSVCACVCVCVYR